MLLRAHKSRSNHETSIVPTATDGLPPWPNDVNGGSSRVLYIPLVWLLPFPAERCTEVDFSPFIGPASSFSTFTLAQSATASTETLTEPQQTIRCTHKLSWNG